MPTEDNRTLYERLGGVYSIAIVVDDSIDRIMVAPRLDANLKWTKHHRVPMQVQILGYGNGLLGNWRAAKVYRTLDEGIASTSHDHGGRTGGLSRRSPADLRQVRRSPTRTGGDQSHRGEHTG